MINDGLFWTTVACEGKLTKIVVQQMIHLIWEWFSMASWLFETHCLHVYAIGYSP